MNCATASAKPLMNPNGDEGIKGCRAGREPAREIVDTWYGKQKGMTFKACTAYEDFRELLEKETGIDGVIVVRPITSMPRYR